MYFSTTERKELTTMNSTGSEIILQVKGEKKFRNKGKLRKSVPSSLTHMERLKKNPQTERIR